MSAAAPSLSVPGTVEVPLTITEAAVGKADFRATFDRVKLGLLAHMNAFATTLPNADQSLGAIRALNEVVMWMERDEMKAYYDATRVRDAQRRLAPPTLSRPNAANPQA